MKILLYGINFSPEVVGIGKYTGEMATWLAAQGHEVRVITAPPYYPAWRVAPGFSAARYSRSRVDGATVFRTPLWVPAQVSGAKRLLHLLSFALFSFPALLAQWRWRPDVVWVVAPALTCAPGACLFARMRGAKAWLHIQDFEVDAAFDLGILKGALLRRVVRRAEQWLLRLFDRVSTISSRMLDRLAVKGVDSARVVSFPNWVDIAAVRPLIEPSVYCAELGLAEGAVVALYSGNMGNKQGLEVLGECARLLLANERIVFVFCGDGPGKAALAAQCAHLPNVRLLPLQPMVRLNELLGLADIHLLPQRADAADLVMPSKLTGMLASGRPVIAAALPETELARVVDGCGLVVPPENAAALAEAVGVLAADAPRRAALGAQGRAFAENSLDRDAVLTRFEAELRHLVAETA